MPLKVHGEMSRTNPTSPKNRPTRTAACAGFPFKVDPMSVSIKQVKRAFRCVLQCQDEVKDKVGPNTPEPELRKFRGEFETCAIACCDKSIAKMPNLLLKLKEAFESGKL